MCKRLTYLLLATVTILFSAHASAQDVTAYPHIPRIDVHAHIAGNPETIANYLEMRKMSIEAHKADLAMWIDVASGNNQIPDMDEEMKNGQGRILPCIADFSSHDGFQIPPAELASYMKKGYVGYKIWAGPWYRKLKEDEEGYRYIDHQDLDPTFAKMEELGMVVASIHIADPNGPYGNRTNWAKDPIEYWREICAWRHVLEKHPNLKAVVAHGDWLVCQDAQLDYLRNMFATFPNLNVDLAATFQYYYMVNPENLREFMIEWSDRIVFGTDIGQMEDPEQAKNRAEAYFRCFRILETDEVVEGGFFGRKETKGLALPEEVLEKIYYKNTMRIYPRVKEQLLKLGYSVD